MITKQLLFVRGLEESLLYFSAVFRKVPPAKSAQSTGYTQPGRKLVLPF